MKGKLYLVATPIGNLKDITLRALEILKTTPIILAEDTRTAGVLLNTYQIKAQKLISYHSKNEAQRLPEALSYLNTGQDVALISEAGTPLISDPGFLLTQGAIKQKIEIISVPGASALTTLLPASGFPLSSFYFGGFLSIKSGKRKNQLAKLKNLETCLVFYESPYRILKTLADMKEIFGSTKKVVIGRELTKKFEEFIRGTLEEVLAPQYFLVKGEFCIILKNY